MTTTIETDTPLRNFQIVTAEEPEEHYIYSVGERYSVASDIELSQSWFWTEAWQVGEREADADIAAGRVTRYYSDEDFLASL